MTITFDLGHGHTASFFGWAPDRALNPQYDGIPDIDRAGLLVEHPDGLRPGERCKSAINFDLPEMHAAGLAAHAVWQVESWDPLTLSPSLLCRRCGDHGFIRGGVWIPA